MGDPQTFRFGSFHLLPAHRELRFNGEPVGLGTRSFDLLFALVRRHGRLVSKDELMAEVWPGKVVEENNLQAQISALRKILARDLDGERYLQTAPGQGYRFLAGIVDNVPSTAVDAAVLPLPDRPSIAVLPFTNMSGDPEQEYFADGVVEDITTELSRFQDLFVIARNSSFHYKGRSPDVRQVGRELGVRYVLEGSVRRDNDRIRITVQLVDATTGAHRWAERYDRELKDVFTVQAEIAQDVAGVLVAHVNRAESERTLLKAPASWQAYDYYLRAADVYATFHRRIDIAAISEARRLLDQCLAMEAGLARAHVLYSATKTSTWGLNLDGDYRSPAAIADAQHWAERAVQLDPNLPQAHVQLAYALCNQGLVEVALTHVERAISLNPSFTDWRFAAVLATAGQGERAVTMGKAHLRRDPFALPIARGFLGFAYLILRQCSEAVGPLREFVSQAPNHSGGRIWLTSAYGHLGELDDARVQAAQLLRIDPGLAATRSARKTETFWRRDDAAFLDAGLQKAGLYVERMNPDEADPDDPHVS